MMKTILRWQLMVGCMAAGVAAVLGLSGAVAGAEPVLPSPPAPAAPGPVAAATPTAAPSTVVPARSGTLRDYFAEKEVRLEPQQAEGFTALDITLPVPQGWTQVPDPNVPDAFAVIANRNSGALYTPNAQVVVYRLIGDFDAGEAIAHGYVDSLKQPAWRTSNASLANFGGFPSSVIAGIYRQNDMTLNTWQRHVIASAGGESYLVSTTVTTGARESAASARATSAIVNGFRVTVPGTTPRATTPAPPAATPATTSPAPTTRAPAAAAPSH
jgi:hypothetical protein